MVLLLLVLCGLLILGIAGYAVSRSSARLARTEGVSVFDLKQAVAWVTKRMPEGVEVGSRDYEPVAAAASGLLASLRRGDFRQC